MASLINRDRLAVNCPILSSLNQDVISDKLIRTFDLNEGDIIMLNGFPAEDCLMVDRGEVQVQIDDAELQTLNSKEVSSRHLSLHKDSGKLTITATSSALVAQIDGVEIDNLLAWQEMLNFVSPDDKELHQKASIVRNSKAFRNVPVELFIDALQKLQPVDVKAGQDVVVQGEKGDAYYFIESGQAEVWALDIYDAQPQLVNELSEGDAFGEEALVMDGSRSATVKMISDGKLLKLEKEDFLKLVSTPMVNWAESGEVKKLVEQGHELLDVRYEEEWEDYSIPGATLIPLQSIRKRFSELDKSKSYVTFCKGGARSAVASLLLGQQGFKTVSLKGGIRDWPYETQSNY